MQKKIQRFKNGDQDAFNEIMVEYDPALKNYISNALDGYYRDMIEDIKQETWLAIYEEIDRYDPGYEFKPFLFGYANNRIKRAIQLKSIKEKKEWEGINNKKKPEENLDYVYDTYPELPESEANDPWHVATKIIFTEPIAEPHKIISFNYAKIIYPARFPGNKKRKNVGQNKRVVEFLSKEKLSKIAGRITKDYGLYLGRKPQNIYIEVFKKRTSDKKLEHYYGKNRISNVTNWSSRVSNKVKKKIEQEFYNIFFDEEGNLLEGCCIERRWASELS